MKFISIVTPCYNEEENVFEVYSQVKEVFSKLKKEFRYEHIFIDNASIDNTQTILRKIASKDKNVKIIINARNFGHIRSPYYGLLQANGEAVILIVSDLQDPITMIFDFLEEWKKGYKIVVGVKNESLESPLFFAIRKLYYSIIGRLSDIPLIKNFTGFGLYDRQVINTLKGINDPYPYLRGLICDIGFKVKEIPYVQPIRKRGFTKNNFYTLYDIAMLGITNHSKIPLRLAAFGGFILSALSFSVALIQILLKFFFWDTYSIGISTLVVGLFFFASVQLFFIGILGEYIGSIHTQILNRPLVVESERINWK
ncbi:glycosyltransferase family 2 protein [Leptospira sp. 201903075]|uniref:glycosyltransferase family 2 protein n=1 Tax=Leptospira chreensis TaxID=2810035 RepID=UPI001962DD96|nr:glycosyltransferase family 2 protein [Leptospira chreensis]MBM9589049.1 glycosyltransferase family 2 protein [Leptospira chreensis]